MNRQRRALPLSLEHHLKAYVLAASAAGVSALALVQPSQAKIVYTPAHKRVRLNEQILLDLNHDGIVDFGIYLSGRTYQGQYILRTFTVAPRAGTRGTNAIWGVQSNKLLCAAALSSGIEVGKNRPLQQRALLMMQTFAGNSLGCQWVDQPSANLGLRFTIAGKQHYGWARLSTVSGVYLTGYAYETIPNKPIITGKEHGDDDAVTLGGLAKGAARLTNQ